MRIVFVGVPEDVRYNLSSCPSARPSNIDALHSFADFVAGKISRDVDVIVFGQELPDGPMLRRIEALRDRGINHPLIALVDGGEVSEIVLHLDGGADDVIDCEVDPREFWARVRSIYSRWQTFGTAPLRIGDWSLHVQVAEVRVHGQTVRLTEMEFRLFALLCDRPDGFWTRAELGRRLYAGQRTPATSTLDVFVCSLRRKLGEAGIDAGCIITERGRGYRWTPTGRPEKLPANERRARLARSGYLARPSRTGELVDRVA